MTADEQLQRIAQSWREEVPFWAGIAANFLVVHGGKDFVGVTGGALRCLKTYWPDSVAVAAVTHRLSVTTLNNMSLLHAQGNARNFWAAHRINDPGKTAVSQLFFGLSQYLASGIPGDAQRGLAGLIAILVEDSGNPDGAFSALLEYLKSIRK